ncbi:peptide MFS transporter [Dasania sp. GY-MA-18]|uniref:Peptide MFS transporter n=1 Tax=Dasania phycosphaerae TaxID=2950436 RepID=A0A9J6RJX3_9GAMM|nr:MULTISPECIES: peptide MFS transporter [Dasania]MCR8921857.1 peptide MFS transporter [Dasania sp. GY-MA-18]MCZ0864285.1 peptide MFS transporter [Dasania phycosphaerae]MCZ0868013.1 peptide MFS transporter [Dasania phycosphaerae]
MSADITASIDTLKISKQDDTAFIGHPKGLGYIIFAEAWERFSFYGMQALLVLYLSSYLLQPGAIEQVIGFSGFRAALESVFGNLSTQALATQFVGLYIGFVYFMPVFGGLIGDRYLGRTRAVIIGAVLMAIGHFLMAVEAAFLFAILFLILGSGFLKGNLAAQVGGLYKKDDTRIDAGYSLYTIAIIVGAFAAPLVCGTLGEFYGWHYGFGAAGIGMIIGMIIYLSGRQHLPIDKPTTKQKDKTKLSKSDVNLVLSIILLLAITALYWTAQSQVWNAYPLWVQARVDRVIFDMTIPVTWFQSMDTFAVLLFAPVVLWLWKRQAARKTEPSDLNKIAIGCAIFAGACLWLGSSEINSNAAPINLLYPVVFHLICSIGFLYASPTTLALVSRAAPASVNAALVGCYYLAIFFGGIFSGWLGRYAEILSPANFWFMHGAIVATGTVLIILLKGSLLKVLIR